MFGGMHENVWGEYGFRFAGANHNDRLLLSRRYLPILDLMLRKD